MERGAYNEILIESIPKQTIRRIRRLVEIAANAEKVDEHGNWEFGAEFDKKGRGFALNWDVYAYGYDMHNGRFLVIVQIRQYSKSTTNGYPRIRKSYFLLGRNEDDTVFAHPVESRVIHDAIKKGKNVIVAAQTWIFGCDYRKVIRHGDVALVPLSRKPIDGLEVNTVKMILQPDGGTASHHLTADKIIVKGDTIYALNPYMRHEPGVHPDVDGEGWFKISIGKRGRFHDFAAPTID
jgi:hypothetical protein